MNYARRLVGFFAEYATQINARGCPNCSDSGADRGHDRDTETETISQASESDTTKRIAAVIDGHIDHRFRLEPGFPVDVSK